MAAPRNSSFRDKYGRYAGPMKTRTAFPPTPYGDDDCCNACGHHYLVDHAPGCALAGPWDDRELSSTA